MVFLHSQQGAKLGRIRNLCIMYKIALIYAVVCRVRRFLLLRGRVHGAISTVTKQNIQSVGQTHNKSIRQTSKQMLNFV